MLLLLWSSRKGGLHNLTWLSVNTRVGWWWLNFPFRVNLAFKFNFCIYIYCCYIPQEHISFTPAYRLRVSLKTTTTYNILYVATMDTNGLYSMFQCSLEINSSIVLIQQFSGGGQIIFLYFLSGKTVNVQLVTEHTCSDVAILWIQMI